MKLATVGKQVSIIVVAVLIAGVLMNKGRDFDFIKLAANGFDT